MSACALYSPYIPKTRGGGERYLLSIAEAAAKLMPTALLVPGELVGATREALPAYERAFGLNLKEVKVIASSIGSLKGPVRTAVESQRYSHLFAMTDGSIFPSLARHSYFIVQVPWKRRLSLPERIKLNTWDFVVVYSRFVRDVIAESWHPKHLQILAPYVDLKDFTPEEKEPIILNVGRFFRHTSSNSKRQDVVIDVFKRLVDKDVLTGYSLVLAGNVDPDPGSQEYLNELKQAAYGYHVNILTNLKYTELRDLYGKAKFYWHAAGFGVDPKTHPENTEHFGMTTLEAMASGAIPLVVPYGGQGEIVTDKALQWESMDELYEKMYHLVHEKKPELSTAVKQMERVAESYSKEKFIADVGVLLK